MYNKKTFASSSTQSTSSRASSSHASSSSSPRPHCVLLFLLLLISCLIQLASSTNIECTTNPPSTLSGCSICDNPATQSLAYNIQTSKYTCTDILQCNSVYNNGTCLSCQPLYFLDAVTVPGSQSCVQIKSLIPNCLLINITSLSSVPPTPQCLQCYPNYYLTPTTTPATSSKCILNSIANCIQYDPALVLTPTCTQCLFQYMKPATNCLVPSTICSIYNYTTHKCFQCPNSLLTLTTKMILSSTGQYCLQPSINNCIIYSYLGCQQCQQQYTLSSSKLSCILTSEINYQFQYDLLNPLCLEVNKYYDSTSVAASKCTAIPSTNTINYCKVQSTTTTTQCQQCLKGYYLSSTKQSCLPCRNSINSNINTNTNGNNCLQCQNQNTCIKCQPEYFLYQQLNLTSNIMVTNCRQCSIYGCSRCQSIVTSSASSPSTASASAKIQCLSCTRNKTLYNGNCYQCPSTSTQLNYITLECESCPTTINNCSYCLNNKCQWCVNGYVKSNDKLKCIKVSDLVQRDVTLSPLTLYQLLIKLFPNQQSLIIQNSIALMSSCLQSSNIYTCLCYQSMIQTTALCYNVSAFASSITSTINFNTVFSTTSTVIDQAIYLQNYQLIRLMAQLPLFDQLTVTIAPSTLMPVNKISSLLQTFTQTLRRNAITSSKYTQTITQLFNLIDNSWIKTFSLTQTVVLFGNGYYLKYYPKGNAITDKNNDFIIVNNRSSITTTAYLIVFVWFQNLISSKSLTGNVHLYNGGGSTSTSTISLSIKQLQYPPSSNGYNYLLYKNNQLVQTSSTSTSSSYTIAKNSSLSNFITINGLLLSTTTTFNIYSVNYQLTSISSALESLYKNQRIQFIFYQPAFVYILIFLILYLFLIPCCSIVDLIDATKQGHRRKRVRSQDMTNSEQQGKRNYNKSNQQSKQSQDIIISVNYRDFFPLYNICNTPRPRRVLKLCLFLLNLQHGITFLTLIYFNLEPGHPVVAVILGLPAYFCSIIMGYICGMLTLILPSWSKYLINIIVLGYWVLWIGLMTTFKSSQYQPYIYIFAIIFFIIDLLIDLLQMYMVYFTIKQQQRQMKMFQCLAIWLSKRGYYQYEKLAKEIKELNNND